MHTTVELNFNLMLQFEYDMHGIIIFKFNINI